MMPETTLAGGGVVLLIHHPAGNHCSPLGERLSAAIPSLFRLPKLSFFFERLPSGGTPG